jgi:hypothetical protein
MDKDLLKAAGAMTRKKLEPMKKAMLDAAEKFWLGPGKDKDAHVIYRAQLNEMELLGCMDGTKMDTTYSEYSVRIFDEGLKSLSFINRTIAILPKSRLRTIYNMIGEYLEKCDK